MCYVDYNKWVELDWSRVRKYHNTKYTSSSDADWRPLITHDTRYAISKEYKQELIEKY